MSRRRRVFVCFLKEIFLSWYVLLYFGFCWGIMMLRVMGWSGFWWVFLGCGLLMS